VATASVGARMVSKGDRERLRARDALLPEDIVYGTPDACVIEPNFRVMLSDPCARECI
jgi:hypothetical protein